MPGGWRLVKVRKMRWKRKRKRSPADYEYSRVTTE